MENNINQLITKVLNQEASAEEIIRFSFWLSETGENRDEYRKLKSYWDADISFNHTFKPELSLQKTQYKINREQQRRKSKRRNLYAISIAASLLILLSVGFFFMNTDRTVTLEYYTYLTENNKINFTLDDGTKIYLNKNSKFVYTSQYNKDNRSVSIEGEAFFEVLHNPEKPFIVEMGDTQIRVLGTSFNVKTDEHANVRTTLTEGSLRFEALDQKVVLIPNQQLFYLSSSRRIEVSSVDVDKELAWTEGVIRLKNVLFSDLIDDLMKQFNVNVVINNEKLKNSSISMTGSFAEDQSLEEILKIISISYPFVWEKKNSSYYIK